MQVGLRQKVSDAIRVIDDMAFQTDLTLNAAVGAAQASDDGKGFKVVAAKVRIN